MAVNEQEMALAELIVSALNLEVSASEIEPDAPLYGDGLGLDSIDILEMSLAISKEYGFQLKSDDEDKTRIFSSLRNLNSYIQQSRTR
jgi:acyl carrier protein